MTKESINKIEGYDTKIVSVDKELLDKRQPVLTMVCGKGFQLLNYRCR